VNTQAPESFQISWEKEFEGNGSNEIILAGKVMVKLSLLLN
jgi:hypothetical protein